MNPKILELQDLHVYYYTKLGVVKAVNGVSFGIDKKTKFGLVGESGCGKTTINMAIVRMIKPPGRIEKGKIFLNGKNLLDLSKNEMRRIRFEQISVIPQGAMSNLNPVIRIKEQIFDLVKAHRSTNGKIYKKGWLKELLGSVDLDYEVAEMYPHELSGGMKQRVCIAMATALNPKFIIADEPTSALDVIVQKKIIETLNRIQSELGITILIIGHDMGIMAQFANRIGVMFAGTIVEIGQMEKIFKEPLHPYAQLLIKSIPSFNDQYQFISTTDVEYSSINLPSGCPFSYRCDKVLSKCKIEKPSLVEVSKDHWVACHRI